MRFSENYYVGAFEENEITLSENIILNSGYEMGTEFELYGGNYNAILYVDVTDLA